MNHSSVSVPLCNVTLMLLPSQGESVSLLLNPGKPGICPCRFHSHAPAEFLSLNGKQVSQASRTMKGQWSGRPEGPASPAELKQPQQTKELNADM